MSSISPESPNLPVRHNLLRARTGQGHEKVTFIELFFDLVFVFAITQLSHSLLEHFTVIGAIHTLLLMMGVWWVWIFTSWVTNWFDPEKIPVRVVLLVIMLIGLVMSSALPEAFETRGLVFAGAYVLIQVGRTAFFVWALRGYPAWLLNFQRILCWLLLSGVFWLAGAFAEGEMRLALWVTALFFEYLSPSVGFWVPGLGQSTTADWSVQGGHLAERCALFIIIALGESVLVTGATLAKMEWTPVTLTAFAVSFVGSIAMWWLYFDTAAEAGSHSFSHSRDPGKVARLYTYLHLFMVAGIIVSAVADEFVLAHPAGHMETGVALTILGGTALYLAGNLFFKWTISGRIPISHAVAIVFLAALFPFAHGIKPVTLSAIATAVLILMAIWERRSGSVRKLEVEIA